MSRDFVTSDTHFYHSNIIKYENRPYANVDDMNQALIRNWNNTVKKDDRVFHLGDVSFSGKLATQDVVEQLNGYKILILGNHDRQRSKTFWKEVGFDEVIPYPIIYKGFYILSHEPIYLNEYMPFVNVHGHLHSQKYAGDQHINVGVENTEYKPLLFSEIEKRFADQEGAQE